jgi:putative ABC transport system permease protein
MSRFPGISRYVRLALLRSRAAEDVDAELAFHLEMKTEALVRAGLAPAAARAEALRQFGDVDRFARDCRALTAGRERAVRRRERLESVWQDVRVAARGLRRSPVYALVAVLTLALGIGGTTAVFSVVSAVLLRPLPYGDADRIVFLTEAPKTGGKEETSTSYPNFLDWQARSRSFESMTIFHGWAPALTGRGEPERVEGAMVTAGLFDVLRVAPVLGRPLLPSDNVPGAERVVVVSHGFWRRHLGGDPAAVGRAITLAGVPRTVVGVLPAGFRGPAELDVELWGNIYPDTGSGRTARYLRAMGRLRPTVTLEQARAELRAISAELERRYPEENDGMVAIATPLREQLVGDVRAQLHLLLAASGLVLLIACANLSNLGLARGVARSREFAVRAALGASRGRGVRQLLTESALLSIAGAGVGFALAAWMTRALIALTPDDMRLARDGGATLDWRVLGFALAATVVTALLSGAVPAVRATRVDLQAALKEGARGSDGTAGLRLRDAFAVVQLGLALALLIGSGLLVKSFARLNAVEPGIDPRGVFAASMNLPVAKYPGEGDKVPEFFAELAERAAALPGVRAAAVTSMVPFSGGIDRIAVDVGERPELRGIDLPEGDRYIVSPGYLATMGVALRAGRFVAESDRDDTQLVAVVDEVFARRIAPGGVARSAIGMHLGVPGRDTMATVVGVVGHVRHYGLDATSGGQIYVSHLQYPWRWMTVVARTDQDPLTLAPAIRRVVRGFDPELPVFGVTTMAALMADRTATRRAATTLAAAFAGVALLLAALGLYGVIAYGVTQRRREFGVRMALGATPANVRRLVVRHGIALAITGLVTGLATAAVGTRLLAGLLFGVTPDDPTVAAGVAALLLGVAVAASYLPARRASRWDPAALLRAE